MIKLATHETHQQVIVESPVKLKKWKYAIEGFLGPKVDDKFESFWSKHLGKKQQTMAIENQEIFAIV